MSFTANALYRDTVSFFRQHSKTIVLISVASAFVTVLLTYLFLPANDQLSQLLAKGNGGDSLMEIIRNMEPDQQRILMHTSAIMTFSALIGNTLLLGGVLRYISASETGKSLSALGAIVSSANVWPRLLIQTFLITLMTQLGFLALIVPGVLLVGLFSLSPILLLQKDRGLITTMKQSVSLCWANFSRVMPAVIAWLALKILLSLAMGSMSSLSSAISALIMNSLSNFISALLVIYLYKLYQTIR